MALLTELDKIERDSTSTPGSPADPEVLAAIALRAKVRTILYLHAKTLLGGGTLTIEGRAAYPDPESGQERNEAIGWAQRVMSNVDGVLPAAFRIALANGADASAALILALGSSTDPAVDTSLKEAFAPLIPLLAKGMHPGR